MERFRSPWKRKVLTPIIAFTLGASCSPPYEGDPHEIGYVGCSNTKDVVTGYYEVSNEDLFWPPYDYNVGGRTIQHWADQAVEDGFALRGPDLGPLSRETTVSDLCHPNANGQLKLGTQLKVFFENQNLQNS